MYAWKQKMGLFSWGKREIALEKRQYWILAHTADLYEKEKLRSWGADIRVQETHPTLTTLKEVLTKRDNVLMFIKSETVTGT